MLHHKIINHLYIHVCIFAWRILKKGLPATNYLLDSEHLKNFNAQIECEQPNQHLYEFVGNLKNNGDDT